MSHSSFDSFISFFFLFLFFYIHVYSLINIISYIISIISARHGSSEAFGEPKANLFFKLHELQTCSWGVSKVGRVAQRIDPNTNYLYSEFDTSIFSLTVIPILGWFKLLPTFGGCVITASKCELLEGGKLDMVVDYTTSRPVPGLSGLGKWIWSINVPVGFVWKLLPWNKGREATCSVDVVYYDDDFRIVQDLDGELFVYSRPVVSREFDIVEKPKEDKPKVLAAAAVEAKEE